jgi:hypothetical protein
MIKTFSKKLEDWIKIAQEYSYFLGLIKPKEDKKGNKPVVKKPASKKNVNDQVKVEAVPIETQISDLEIDISCVPSFLSWGPTSDIIAKLTEQAIIT